MRKAIQHSEVNPWPAQARIASVVRLLLAARKESQVELAEVLHIDQASLSRMLRGERKMTVDELDAIATHFGHDIEVFYKGADELVRSRCSSPLVLVSSVPVQTSLNLFPEETHVEHPRRRHLSSVRS